METRIGTWPIGGGRRLDQTVGSWRGVHTSLFVTELRSNARRGMISTASQSLSMSLIASITGLPLRTAGEGWPGARSCLLTQSYCSHPLRGALRSTDFHLGCPFLTS